MEDARLAFIAPSCQSASSSRDKDLIADCVSRSKDVSFFLDDSNCKSLRARISSSGDISFTTQLNSASKADENSVDVVFVRRKPEPINSYTCTAHWMYKRAWEPFRWSLSYLKAVWCPALLDNSSVANNLLSKSCATVDQFGTNSWLICTGSDATSVRDGDELHEISTINTPYDELCFWRDLKNSRRSPVR